MKAKNAINGQRVVLKVDYDRLRAGDTGTIVGRGSVETSIAVKWDNPKSSYHTCSGLCASSNGWYVDVGNIRKLKEVVQDETI